MRGFVQHLITLTLVILITSSVFGQRLKVAETHGDYFKQRARYITNIYERPSGGYWSIGNGFVQKLDDDMNLVDEKRLDLFYEGSYLELENIVRFQDEFYLFMSFVNAKKKKRYLFYTLFDAIDLKPTGDVYKIAEVKAGVDKNMTSSSFGIDISENEEFILITGNDAQRRKTSKRKWFNFGRSSGGSSADEVGTHVFKFTYWVLDKEMQIVNYVKRHELEIENSSDKFYVRQVRVDDSGSVYILGKNVITEQYKTTRDRLGSGDRDQIETAAFILEKIDKDGFTYQYRTAEGAIYIDMVLLFTQDKQSMLVGLSGEEVNGSGVYTTGVYRASLDQELNLLNEQEQAFTEEVLNGVNDIREAEENMSDRKKRRRARRSKRKSDEKKEREALAKRAALNIKYISYADVDEEGNPVLVLEERYVRVVTTTRYNSDGSTTTTTTYYYHYEDLIMVKFTEDDIYQNFYKKYYVSVNAPLSRSLDVSLKNNAITVLSQRNIVRASPDLSSVKDYQLRAFESKQPDIKWSGSRKFSFRKALSDDVIVTAAQRKRRVMWYKFEIKN